MALMTRDEFIVHAREALSPEALEPLFETIAQHNSEVAAFGDSWPGAIVDIRKAIRSAHRLEETLARLEGREPHPLNFPLLRSPR